MLPYVSDLWQTKTEAPSRLLIYSVLVLLKDSAPGLYLEGSGSA